MLERGGVAAGDQLRLGVGLSRLARERAVEPRRQLALDRVRIAVEAGRVLDAVDDQAAERHPRLAQLAVEEDRLADRVGLGRGDDEELRRGVAEDRLDDGGSLAEAFDQAAERAEEQRDVAQEVDAGHALEDAEDDAAAASDDARGQAGRREERP